MYKNVVLDNGLQIILNHMPHMTSASIGVWIATGSRNENTALSGISHFLEHIIFKGTPTRTSKQIKQDIEGRGGSLNGFTSEEVTCYLTKVSSQHTEIGLDVVSDIALNANIDQKDIDRERTVILEEIKMYKDIPSHHVHDMLSELMWHNHPLGLSIAGDIKSINCINRQDMVDYKSKNYIPKNMALVLCGNLNYDSIMQKVESRFHINPKGKGSGFIKFNNSQSIPQLKILYKDTAQSHLSMGLHASGRMSEDRFTLSLLHIILGANMSSRLFENIREKKGIAYEIGTDIKRYKDTGGFIINAGIEHKNVPKAVSLILRELKKIKTSPISLKELKRAKEFFKVQLGLALEETLEHMLWLGEHITLSGKLPDKDEIIKKIDAVSIDDILRVSKDIFKGKNLNMAIIGTLGDKDKKEIEQELEL